MQMQPYTRGETLPAPFPQQREPVAERNGQYGYNEWNAYTGWPNVAGSTATVPSSPPQAPVPQPQPTYLQVLLQQIQKRKRLLFFWLIVTAGVATFVVISYGKPMWKAEGTLYYSPNFNISNKRLYTPPNIQTILRIVRSPEILEKVRNEKNIPTTTEAMQARLTVNVVSQSDLISVAFEWPNKEQTEEVARRILELAIEQYENLRRKLSSQAIIDLEDSLKRASEDELDWRLKLTDMLGQKKVFDLRIEKDNVVNEVSRLRLEIASAESEAFRLEQHIANIEQKIKEELAKAEVGSTDSQSDAQLQLLNRRRDILKLQGDRQRDVEQAKIKLKQFEETRKNWLPLYQKQYVSKQEWLALEADIATQRNIIAGSKEEIEAEIKEMDKRILEAKKGSGSPLVAQARIDRQNAEFLLKSIPNKITDLNKTLKERLAHQQYLSSVEKEAMPIIQAIEALQLGRTNMTQTKQDHQKLESNKLNELSIYSSPSTGGAPSSSNFAKLGLGVFALSLLLFVGFIACFDMPGLMAKPAPPALAPAPFGPPVSVPAPYGSPASVPTSPFAPPFAPASQLPVPVWQHYPPPVQQQPRGQSMNNEHLRALSERIAHGTKERGSVVLFTPMTANLRVEALLGDLGCFCLKNGGKVLVFEARTDAEGPMYPAWTGPSAREVGDHLEIYLEGRSERAAPCFAETLLTSIDYARGDLSRQLSSVMSMYRFRQMLHEIKDRYSLVLMIVPERYSASEIDVFRAVAEGIVVVINQDANPAEVEKYLRELQASQTPVFGAVTVPPG